MADNVIQIIIRAKDEVTQAIQKASASLSSFRNQVSSLGTEKLSKAFGDLTDRGQRLGQALASGNFTGAAREFSGLVSSARKTSEATQVAGAAAEGAAESFAGLSTSTIVATAGVVALGVAALATAAATLKAADEGARYADTIGDLSARTGIAVEDLSRLAFAAQQSDVDLGTLATGVKFLNRNLDEAKNGTGEAAEAFARLGISAQDIQRGFGGTEGTLLAISERFSKLTDQTQRTAIAMAIFGRSGDALIPFLNAGPAKIKELTATADRLGITVTKAAAIIGDDYTHAQERLQGAMTGLKVQLSTAVIPAVTSFIDTITEAVGSVNTLRQVVSSGSIDIGDLFPPGPLKDAADAWEKIAHAIELYNRVAQIAAALPGLPDQSPESPATANRTAQPSPASFFGPDPGRSILAPLEQQAAADAAEDLEKKLKADRDEAARLGLEAKKMGEAFDLALSRAYSLSEAFGESLQKTLGTKAATGVIPDIQKAVDEAAKEVKDKGIVIPVELDIHRATEPTAIADTTALPTIKPQLSAASAEGEKLVATFEKMGIPVDHLIERLAVIGPALSGVEAIGVAVGASLEDAFSQAFNPLTVGIEGTYQAVGNLRQTFDQAGSALSAAIVNGNTGFLTLTKTINGAANAMKRLIVELTIAIVKALILKAIGGFLGLASGGTVASTGGTIQGRGGFSGGAILRPSFSAGGTMIQRAQRAIPSFAAGGTLAAALIASPLVPHFGSGGMWTVPGSPQAHDSVLAALAPGETAILPTVGGLRPGDQVTSLIRSASVVEKTVTNMERAAEGGSSPMIGTLVVQGYDADSIRNAVRPGGKIDRELARRDELGRS